MELPDAMCGCGLHEAAIDSAWVRLCGDLALRCCAEAHRYEVKYNGQYYGTVC